MISDKKVKGTDLRVCFPLEDTQRMLGSFCTCTMEVDTVGEKEARSIVAQCNLLPSQTSKLAGVAMLLTASSSSHGDCILLLTK